MYSSLFAAVGSRIRSDRGHASAASARPFEALDLFYGVRQRLVSRLRQNESQQPGQQRETADHSRHRPRHRPRLTHTHTSHITRWCYIRRINKKTIFRCHSDDFIIVTTSVRWRTAIKKVAGLKHQVEDMLYNLARTCTLKYIHVYLVLTSSPAPTSALKYLTLTCILFYLRLPVL